MKPPSDDYVQVKAQMVATVNAQLECNTQAELDAQYTRSINAFQCPVCKRGRQRVIVASQDKVYSAWEYTCDNEMCFARGTRSWIETTAAVISAYPPTPQREPRRRCPECSAWYGECEHTAPIESMGAEHIVNGQA